MVIVKRKNPIQFILMEHKYKKDLNHINIESISKFSINKILKAETKKDRQIYLRGIVGK